MKFIGVTGGVGAGKSEILKYLASRGDSRVMLADDIARDLTEPGGVCYSKLQELFAGDDVFREDGSMDRARAASVIFEQQEKRRAMNGIVHPAVKEYVLSQADMERERGEIDYLFLEAALLIEDHYDEICDELWYIYTSEENRKKRLMASRGYSSRKIERIMHSQMTEEEYRRHCSHEIDNNGTQEEAVAQVARLLADETVREKHTWTIQ